MAIKESRGIIPSGAADAKEFYVGNIRTTRSRGPCIGPCKCACIVPPKCGPGPCKNITTNKIKG